LRRGEVEKLRFEDTPRERNVVGAERVDADGGEVRHGCRIVHSPRDNACARCVGRLYECFVHEGPLAPEVAAGDGCEGMEGIDGIADLEDAARNLGCEPLRLGDLSVIEGVDCTTDAGVADGGKSARRGARTLEFAVCREASGGEEGERGIEGGRRVCLGVRIGRVVRTACRALGATRWDRVVMHPQHPVWVQVDVQLHAVRTQLGCPLEGREGVFGALAGGSTVGNQLGTGHGDILTLRPPERLT
jgi:hypothetical protein